MNSFTQLVKYFTSNERPVSYVEFSYFWKSLDDAEKIYYMYVNLRTGLFPDELK